MSKALGVGDCVRLRFQWLRWRTTRQQRSYASRRGHILGRCGKRGYVVHWGSHISVHHYRHLERA